MPIATVLKEDWVEGEVAVYNNGCSPSYLPNDKYTSTERRGQAVVVLEVIDEPSSEYDLEVLPMFKVRFPDGYQCVLWADEMIGA